MKVWHPYQYQYHHSSAADPDSMGVAPKIVRNMSDDISSTAGPQDPVQLPTDPMSASAFFKAVMSLASQLPRETDSSQSRVSTDSSARTVSADSFISCTVSRFEAYQARRAEKLELSRRERERLQLAEVRDRPCINASARKLVSGSAGLAADTT